MGTSADEVDAGEVKVRRKTNTPRTMYAGLHPCKRPVSHTLLYLWLKKNGISKDGFARRVGCNGKLVDYWCNGQCVPTLAYAFQIEKVTKGGVPAASWLGSELGRLVWEEMQSRAKSA